MSSEANDPRGEDMTASPEWEQPTRPTVSIYQNPEYVEGILQQLFEQPVFTEYSVENRHDQQDSGSKTRGHRTSVRGNIGFLGAGQAEASGALEGGRSEDHRTAAGGTGVSRGKFTQPYYLHTVRGALKSKKLIRRPRGASSAENLRPGDFVEFTTQFTSNQVNTLLDIATPGLVEAAARKMAHDKEMASFKGGDLEKVQAFKLTMDAKQDAWGAIGRSLTEAIKADFRASKTREFYGQLGTGDEQLTVITMCDTAHFVVEDEDRILDGTFTVLAKVVGPVVDDEPVLARNKLLARVHPEALDYGIEKFNAMVQKQTDRLGSRAMEDDADDQIFDLSLESRVNGPSIRVIPVAIFV